MQNDPRPASLTRASTRGPKTVDALTVDLVHMFSSPTPVFHLVILPFSRFAGVASLLPRGQPRDQPYSRYFNRQAGHQEHHDGHVFPHHEKIMAMYDHHSRRAEEHTSGRSSQRRSSAEREGTEEACAPPSGSLHSDRSGSRPQQ